MRNNFPLGYIKRARKVALLLSLVPFVRMISVSGSLAREEATKKSDIDFFVVLKSGRLYSGRAIVTMMVQLMGLRRHDKHIAGMICLNRYHTDDNLEIHPQNLYHARDYTRIKVLTERHHLFERYKYMNEWMKSVFRYPFSADGKKYQIDQFYLWPLWAVQMLLEIIYDVILGDWGEKVLRQYQIKRILTDERTIRSEKGKIFISDTELRFHPEKRG